MLSLLDFFEELPEARLPSDPALGDLSRLLPLGRSSDSPPLLGVRDFRGRSVGPTFREDLRKSLLGHLIAELPELELHVLVGESALLGGAGGLFTRFSTEDCREFKRIALGGESLDFVDFDELKEPFVLGGDTASVDFDEHPLLLGGDRASDDFPELTFPLVLGGDSASEDLAELTEPLVLAGETVSGIG